jgi:hypothetical protein
MGWILPPRQRGLSTTLAPAGERAIGVHTNRHSGNPAAWSRLCRTHPTATAAPESSATSARTARSGATSSTTGMSTAPACGSPALVPCLFPPPRGWRSPYGRGLRRLLFRGCESDAGVDRAHRRLHLVEMRASSPVVSSLSQCARYATANSTRCPSTRRHLPQSAGSGWRLSTKCLFPAPIRRGHVRRIRGPKRRNGGFAGYLRMGGAGLEPATSCL